MSFDKLALLAACRRSRIKFRTYAALSNLALALPEELAEAAHTDTRRVLAVLHGDGRSFRRTTALIELGAATWVRTPRGWACEITPDGVQAFAFVQARVRARERGRGPEEATGT